jgi:hypothetical protein
MSDTRKIYSKIIADPNFYSLTERTEIVLEWLLHDYEVIAVNTTSKVSASGYLGYLTVIYYRMKA